MAIKIQFNVARTPESPTLILAKRDSTKLGMLTPCEINLKGCLNAADEIQFKLHKEIDGMPCPLGIRLRTLNWYTVKNGMPGLKL